MGGLHCAADLLKLSLLRKAGDGDMRPRKGGRSDIFMFVKRSKKRDTYLVVEEDVF